MAQQIGHHVMAQQIGHDTTDWSWHNRLVMSWHNRLVNMSWHMINSNRRDEILNVFFQNVHFWCTSSQYILQHISHYVMACYGWYSERLIMMIFFFRVCLSDVLPPRLCHQSTAGLTRAENTTRGKWLIFYISNFKVCISMGLYHFEKVHVWLMSLNNHFQIWLHIGWLLCC